MPTTVAIFQRRADAERASDQLGSIGIPKDQVVVLTPNADRADVAAVPTTPGEQPGIVKGLAAVTGGAMGLGAAGLLLPAVGPVLAIGLTGGALLGSLTGAAVGSAVEDALFPGIPEQELFIYEDALRQGRTAVVAVADDQNQVTAARRIFHDTGAESIDRARHMWWVGIRAIEKENYATIGDFAADESTFRRGFEAALNVRNIGKSYSEFLEGVRKRNSSVVGTPAFQHGYERGRAYLQERREERTWQPHNGGSRR
jgi:hypothetical protein